MTDLGFEIVHTGDRVRSLDFPDNPALAETCFVEGVVTDIVQWQDCAHYEITVSRKVSGGHEMELSSFAPEPFRVYPPVNGTPRAVAGGVTNGVHKILEEV